MATAEQLFGRFGIDGVSLREIGTAAGQTNTSAVQYHFKDKHSLAVAIINDRLVRIEPMLREQIDRLVEDDTLDDRGLLRALWQSMTMFRGDNGDHPFCRFFLQFVLQPHDHPTRDLAAFRRSRKVPAELPQLARLHRLLRGQYEALSPSAYVARIRIVGRMFLAAIVEHDNARLFVPGKGQSDFDFELILDLSTAAMAAPQRK
jgi:AcrR family transcriptional regulator